jgi:hypothetical protein
VLTGHYLFTKGGSAQNSTEQIIALLDGGIEQLNLLRQMHPAGPPTLPPEYDVWLYEAVEGEDAGLDRPAAKPRHYATPFDDRVLVFLMFRKAISTMRLLHGPVKIDKKPVLKEVC